MTTISPERIRAEMETVQEIVNDMMERELQARGTGNPLAGDLFQKYISLMMRRYEKLERRCR
jgi:hypothetical protein